MQDFEESAAISAAGSGSDRASRGLDVHIGFIDHDNALLRDHRNGDVINGLGDYRADLSFVTYAELIHELGGAVSLASHHRDLFARLVHDRLATYHVPRYVQDRYAHIVGAVTSASHTD